MRVLLSTILPSSASAACSSFDMSSIGYPELTYSSTSGQLCFHQQGDSTPVNLVNAGIRCLDNVEDKNQGEPNTCAGTNPINITIANKYQREDDYRGGGVFPLMVSRAYNSRVGSWRFFPGIDESVGGAVSVIRADGKKLFFLSNGNNGWVTDADVTGVLEKLENGSGNHTGWRYITLDNQIEEYDATGVIVSVTNRTGISQAYVRTANDITVTHSLSNDELVYQLDGSGRVSGFTDSDSNSYIYGYDTQSRLSSITYPNSGGARIYHYESLWVESSLTGITDANGNRFATWTYSNDNTGKATSSQHYNGADLVTLDYTHIDDPVDPRTTATNPLGKQTTYHFTDIHGVRKVTQVEGHQSNNCAAANKAYTYDTNGFLETKTDWQGNVTRYTRNAKGQELTRIEAENTSEQRTITTDWHATFNVPTKITESDREATFTYDVNGNQKTRVVSETP